VLDKVEQTAQGLTTLPMRGRVVPELATFGIHIYREIIMSPWRIIYRVSGKTVHVLAVVDGRRNLEDLLLERFLR
jgi:plasmid stabilization system protein ParE